MTDQVDPARVTLLTRPGCHLCEPVRETIISICQPRGITYRELDVTQDEDLEGEFGQQLPVVLVDGEVVATYRLAAEDLLAALG